MWVVFFSSFIFYSVQLTEKETAVCVSIYWCYDFHGQVFSWHHLRSVLDFEVRLGSSSTSLSSVSAFSQTVLCLLAEFAGVSLNPFFSLPVKYSLCLWLQHTTSSTLCTTLDGPFMKVCALCSPNMLIAAKESQSTGLVSRLNPACFHVPLQPFETKFCGEGADFLLRTLPLSHTIVLILQSDNSWPDLLINTLLRSEGSRISLLIGEECLGFSSRALRTM